MIKKINIGNLGLYKEFEWDSIKDKGSNVIELKKENIFYGRNYSGKTTLSRVVRALETKEISSKYIDPKFEVVLNNNVIFNENNFKENSLNIRCFNEDFIKENLKFIFDHESEIVPFAILGDNTDLDVQIGAIKSELGSNVKDEETNLYKDSLDASDLTNLLFDEHSDLEKALNNQLTTKATSGSESIKKRHEIFGDINYNITKLKQDLVIVLDPSFKEIDADKEKLNHQVIKEIQKEDVTLELSFEPKFEELYLATKVLLEKPLLDSGKIEELLLNVQLNNWVKTGLNLHDESQNCKCKFCGNQIQQSRWKELDNHFDEESKELESSLKQIRVKIEEEKTKAETFVLPNKASMYLSFQNELEAFVNDLRNLLSEYIRELEKLIDKINNRLKNIHLTITLDNENNIDSKDFLSLIETFYDIKKRNNIYSNELNAEITCAKKELRLLEVKRFTETIQYSNQLVQIKLKEEKYKLSKDKVDLISKNIEEKEEQIADLTRLLNNEEEGAKKVNEYLQNYFGHQNLSLKSIEEEVDSEKKVRFNIVRGDSIAYHLSEGESSIISFCYFMAKLDDIHTAGQKPIVLIDDPISSLDSNHIFYVYSLINAELFHKDRFEQIFISTHNLDFLKYLKRLKLTRNQHEFFIINRYFDYSTITAMPNYLKDYITEFNYLFDQIYKCANAELITDENHHLFYNFGNNARKFLEALLFYKYPSRIENQTNNANSKRLLKYFGDDNQATILTERVNNELSHLEEIFDRGMQPIEIPEIKRVAQFILDKIKDKDVEQYEALLQSIGATVETT